MKVKTRAEFCAVEISVTYPVGGPPQVIRKFHYYNADMCFLYSLDKPPDGWEVSEPEVIGVSEMKPLT